MTKRASWGGMLVWPLAATVLCRTPPAQEPEPWTVVDVTFSVMQPQGDYVELLFSNGAILQRGTLQIRADSGLVLLDREEAFELQETLLGDAELPRRTAPQPSARRRTTESLLRERLRSFLQASGQADEPPGVAPAGVSFELFRYMYLEGGIRVVQDGIEVIRAERLYFSPAEDRLTLEDAELRLISAAAPTPRRRPGMPLPDYGQVASAVPFEEETIVTVRGASIVRRGSRWTGRDLSVTTCTAGEPHVEVFAGEVEILERGEEFEIRSRSNHLAFSGVRVLPLPDVSYFTGDQGSFPVRGVSVGSSNQQGFQAGVGLGASMNELGGALHELVTGRPGEEFRGDWNLDVEYIEKRGVPAHARVEYRAADLYFGYTEGFYLDDRGENIREITNRLDGSLIDSDDRGLLRSENRVVLGEGTDLDLTVFYGKDPAVYSEFFGRDYREDRFPETSAYVKSFSDNRLFTVKGRWNLADFSYQDNRAQAPFFVEQLPLATFDWFSEPILQMPWDAPLQLTVSTGAGQLRRNFDSTVPGTGEGDTFRFDQELELASPFWIGHAGFRPFASARYTYYDNTVAGTSDDRWAFAAGVSAGTRLSRTWSSVDADGRPRSLRHVIAPWVAFVNRFRVGGMPTDFIPYDQVDQIDEGALIQMRLLNILERSRRPEDGGGIDQFAWLDLVQNFHPISDRDNSGEVLGLLEYELILRPSTWIPVPDLSLLLEGEWDHDMTEMRTFNTAVNFGKVLGVNWYGEYRTDTVSDGTIGYGANTDMFDRWQLSGGSQYDRALDKHINYAANLIRHDHDWSLFLRVDFDNISGNTSFSINFEPRLGSLFRSRERSLYAGRLYGGGSGTIF